MRQAIQTKFLGWTDTKEKRIKAKCQAGSLTVNWDDGLSPRGNHIRAAKALADKLKWDGPMYGGCLDDIYCVFVFTDEDIR
jgi:hypothetical protein